MIRKCFELLKNNTILFAVYGVYSLAMYLIILIMEPSGINRFPANNIYDFDAVSYFRMIGLLLLAALLIFVISLLFISGYGNMLRNAIISGKTTIKDFKPGIVRYFGRIILAILLLIAFGIGLSILLSLLLAPLSLLAMRNISLNNILMVSLFATIITSGVVILAMPFVILWIPAMFMDDLGVIKGMTKGAKAGANNYGKLLLLMLAIYIPSILYAVINYYLLRSGSLLVWGTLPIYMVSMLLSAFYVPLTFIIYRESNPPVNYQGQIN